MVSDSRPVVSDGAQDGNKSIRAIMGFGEPARAVLSVRHKSHPGDLECEIHSAYLFPVTYRWRAGYDEYTLHDDLCLLSCAVCAAEAASRYDFDSASDAVDEAAAAYMEHAAVGHDGGPFVDETPGPGMGGGMIRTKRVESHDDYEFAMEQA